MNGQWVGHNEISREDKYLLHAGQVRFGDD